MTNHRSYIDRIRGRIPEGDLRFTFSRSSGPGGQNVNKVATRVTLWFDLADAPYLDEREKSRVQRAYPGRIGADGRLRVSSMRHRTQSANRQACIERFYELIAAALAPKRARRKTRIPKGATKRRLEDKRRRGETKRLRQRPVRADD